MAPAPLPVADRDRWLALGLLVAALLLAYFVLVHPWWTVPMLEANERIASLQQRELRQRMELQQAPQVRERLAQLEADVLVSESQLTNKRLTAAQDLVWALINHPSFLFNR